MLDVSCQTERLNCTRRGNQIPHVSCSLSLRHLDRFLLILITIITLHPPCLPFARTHSVTRSINIGCSVRLEDFRLRTNVSSPSLTSDFSIQKSLLKKTSSVGSFLLFNDCRRIRSFFRRSSERLHSTATAYRHRRLRWFLHPDRNGYHDRGQGSCRRRIPTSHRRGRS